ncbi:MAG: phosphoribosylanthranilate isomerase [Marinilabiliales bacterium]|nr:MAG: phosphoribosylanthranilate isomerase [Marinilabiliales bacterium]
MKLKVCGLNNPDNLWKLVKVKPDYIGFIFYKKSKRYVGDQISSKDLDQIPKNIKRVGVFVNEDIELVQRIKKQYRLDYVQLHGDENQSYCARLFLKRIPIIKAFSIDESFDFKSVDAYTPFCSYFLFDTKGALHGGNGVKFDWTLLNNYNFMLPFFLSGGIKSGDAEVIKNLSLRMMCGIDINSQFETEPGVKDISRVQAFKQKLNRINTMSYEN